MLNISLAKTHIWYKLKDAKLILLGSLIILFLFLTLHNVPRQESQNFINSDATWHTLLTVKAMQDTPAYIHKFLPIVSLGHPEDKWIPWGGTVTDKYGNYYYTSFMPLQFIVPYIYFQVTQLPLDEPGIYWLSCFFSLCCFLASVRLFYKLFSDKLPYWFIYISVFCIYFFLPEMIHSNSRIFWGQSMFQLFFVLQLNVYLLLRGKKSVRVLLIFFMLSLLSAVSEWTGSISNVGFSLAFLLDSGGLRRQKGRLSVTRQNIYCSLIAIGSNIIAIFLFVWHFSLAIEVNVLLNSLYGRFTVRNILHKVPLSKLFIGYFQSFHLYLILLLIVFFAALHLQIRTHRPLDKSKLRFNLIIALLMLFPLLENLIMKQHAIAYTYDRMKAIFFLIWLFLFCMTVIVHTRKKISAKTCLTGTLCTLFLLSSYNYIQYISMIGFSPYLWEEKDYKFNPVFCDYISSEFNHDNSILSSIATVRGYDNLSFGRGIYEGKNPNTAFELAMVKDKPFSVLIYPSGGKWNKNFYKKALVIDTYLLQSQFIILNPEHGQFEIINDVTVATSLTDGNWEKGIDTSNNVVLFEQSPLNDKLLENAAFLSSGGTVIPIKNIEYNGSWTHVVFDKDIDISNFEYPNIIEVIYG